MKNAVLDDRVVDSLLAPDEIINMIQSGLDVLWKHHFGHNCPRVLEDSDTPTKKVENE
eukprot:CAMPEP_0198345794 /NCGR_PEP_ID=MMETSP1450-20131203/76203_1 /TAXON_ID=753684 ORGANISM="Madagascaria erythrocladiodes, Strain CCMP3234" /NCGR_SAMPLE_ID=MMETSP1450 /ASSEMBLY_ACC=CAM_ASM_001115 /LENGTH=57 /DNA_ID=CAMNT_0044051165 /DNA_START=179 /DNA_END=349 /DNA_ORIENTATION=+